MQTVLFGWTRTLLNKWEVAGYTKLSDLRDSHPTNKDNRPSNVPDWSEPNYENGTDEKDRLRTSSSSSKISN